MRPLETIAAALRELASPEVAKTAASRTPTAAEPTRLETQLGVKLSEPTRAKLAALGTDAMEELIHALTTKRANVDVAPMGEVSDLPVVDADGRAAMTDDPDEEFANAVLSRAM